MAAVIAAGLLLSQSPTPTPCATNLLIQISCSQLQPGPHYGIKCSQGTPGESPKEKALHCEETLTNWEAQQYRVESNRVSKCLCWNCAPLCCNLKSAGDPAHPYLPLMGTVLTGDLRPQNSLAHELCGLILIHTVLKT